MSSYEMLAAEQFKERVQAAVLDTIDNLDSFVEDVALDPESATPESVAALPKVADAICHLVNVADNNGWLES